MRKSEKVNDIEKIYDTVNNEIADDKLDCVAGGSGADNKYAAVKTGDQRQCDVQTPSVGYSIPLWKNSR